MSCKHNRIKIFKSDNLFFLFFCNAKETKEIKEKEKRKEKKIVDFIFGKQIASP
jgi:hypothetical protein